MAQSSAFWRDDDAPPPMKQRRRSGVFSGDARSNQVRLKCFRMRAPPLLQMLVRWENMKNWIDKERFEALTSEQVELLHSLIATHEDVDPHYLIEQILATSAETQAARGTISKEMQRNIVATTAFERELKRVII